jgi:hypothetical protein
MFVISTELRIRVYNSRDKNTQSRISWATHAQSFQ